MSICDAFCCRNNKLSRMTHLGHFFCQASEKLFHFSFDRLVTKHKDYIKDQLEVVLKDFFVLNLNSWAY